MTEKTASVLLSACASVVYETSRDPGRNSRLTSLSALVPDLESFVRGYELIDDPSIDSDDEILNWCFTEVVTDLFSSIWLLSSGFYKASASSARNALEIGAAALYFQIRENTDPRSGRWNRFFTDWDSGLKSTPNWGEMKPLFARQPGVISIIAMHNRDPIEDAYNHFKYLCSFTHTNAYAPDGGAVTAINMTGIAPAFSEEYFARGCEIIERTVTEIATLWQVCFPQIGATEPLGSLVGSSYDRLFPAPDRHLYLS